ncbi:hypothetical protein OU787_00525 [Kitasatospora sp. YST-16]|uniref:hypothetical protein n=1 Tax=Kitasatospora sp. YST-16 TaxID=2998080 RepID=UPI00228413D4|nr:hypothetical protein [Kitasatospora sp. YST-16]WAL70110.1 hypothetical protein OU787_00525 [Kitasatospora sp. YST-16]
MTEVSRIIVLICLVPSFLVLPSLLLLAIDRNLSAVELPGDSAACPGVGGRVYGLCDVCSRVGFMSIA